MTGRRAIASAFVLALTFASARAPAQGNDAAASARELFRVGQEDMKSGRFDAACTKFAEAQRLDPNVGYLVNLARCDEKRERLADARESWLKALDLAKVRNDPRLGDVQAGLDSIDKQVPRIVVRASGTPPAGLVIQRDDVTLTSASLGVPLPINPGHHVILASAPGRQKWTKEIDVRVGDPIATVDVPELASEQTAAASAPSSATDRSPPTSEGQGGSTQRTLGLVSGGLGLAAAGVGTYFVFRAVSLDQDSEQLCDPGNTTSCSKDGVALREDALGAADIATVAFVAAAVFVAAGAVLYLTAPSRAKSATTSFSTGGFVHRF
jgi:tetratricopeptide (TPR) repeat protein